MKNCKKIVLITVHVTVIHQVSPDGKQFSITSPDRRIRVFWFRTGKLRRVYDESLEVIPIMSGFSFRIYFLVESFVMIDYLVLVRWLKIFREVMLPCTGWRLLILGEEWLLIKKLKRQKVHHNQMLFLTKAQTSLYMPPS